ncbi:MAG: FAD-dependent oxidoreductase [Deltaproteobacteria bacterium]|nr:FAD-dependent oxidoreductase [Deltaproteobacteria bacterium]
MKHAVVIVGGSAGGVQAAICTQKHHGIDDVLVIRQEDTVMVPCGIPYIYGTLRAVDKNVMPDKLLGAAKLKIGEVTAINREAKTVSLSSGEEIGYDKLVLATGSQPVQPPIPGMDKENVYAVRKEPEYLHRLYMAMDTAEHIVVIGGGFIGVEFADECRKRGHEVAIVEILDHCLELVCPKDLCVRAEDVLKASGVKVFTGNALKSIGGNDRAEYVTLNDGQQIKCDMVIVGIGVSPNNKLAAQAGLEIGPTGGIKVDEFQRTGDSNVFAVGDCAEKYSFYNGEPVPIRLASVATREAKIAAANLFSPRWRNVGTIGVFSTVVGDMAIAMAGLSDIQATKRGYDVVIGEAEAVSKHPGTMPDAKPMRVKLCFDRRSGKLLGGCACCTMSVGEVGNLIAAAIVNNMTIEQVALFPMGTHPWLTASPLAYQLTDAASNALHKVIKSS